MDSFSFFVISGFFFAFYRVHIDAAQAGIFRKDVAVFFALGTLGGVWGVEYLSFLQFNEFYSSGNLSSAGHLTWYGSFLGGTFLVLLGRRFYFNKTLKLANLFAPNIAAGYGIGRLGCWLSKDGCLGIPCTSTIPAIFCVRTDFGMLINTPLFESLWNIILFFTLKRLQIKYRLASFLLLHSLGRFTVEFIRTNPKVFHSFSFAQIFSMILIIAGLLLLRRSRFIS